MQFSVSFPHQLSRWRLSNQSDDGAALAFGQPRFSSSSRRILQPVDAQRIETRHTLANRLRMAHQLNGYVLGRFAFPTRHHHAGTSDHIGGGLSGGCRIGGRTALFSIPWLAGVKYLGGWSLSPPF